MKRFEMPIHGKAYPMCFSLRTVFDCEEKFGGMDHLTSALSGGIGALKNCIWLLARMLDAGARHDRMNGVEVAEPPDEDDLLDLFGLDDLAELRSTLLEGIAVNQARTVEAAPGKNGDGGEAEAPSL